MTQRVEAMIFRCLTGVLLLVLVGFVTWVVLELTEQHERTQKTTYVHTPAGQMNLAEIENSNDPAIRMYPEALGDCKRVLGAQRFTDSRPYYPEDIVQACEKMYEERYADRYEDLRSQLRKVGYLDE